MKEKRNLGVLVVDMQKEFEGGIDNKFQLVSSQLKLLKYAKQNNLPIFVLEYVGAGSVFDYLIREIKDYSNKIFVKKYHNDAFIVKKYDNGSFCYSDESEVYFIGDSHLDLELKNKQINDLIVTGVNRYICVFSTVYDAIGRGYKINTSNDLMNHPKEKEESDWFSENTNYFESIDELIHSLK